MRKNCKTQDQTDIAFNEIKEMRRHSIFDLHTAEMTRKSVQGAFEKLAILQKKRYFKK